MPKESQPTELSVVNTNQNDENGVTEESEQKIKIENPPKKGDQKMEITDNNTAGEPVDSKENILTGTVNDNESSANGRWVVGQLAWAHVSNYPYWPCIITMDPLEGIYNKEKRKC